MSTQRGNDPKLLEIHDIKEKSWSNRIFRQNDTNQSSKKDVYAFKWGYLVYIEVAFQIVNNLIVLMSKLFVSDRWRHPRE